MNPNTTQLSQNLAAADIAVGEARNRLADARAKRNAPCLPPDHPALLTYNIAVEAYEKAYEAYAESFRAKPPPSFTVYLKRPTTPDPVEQRECKNCHIPLGMLSQSYFTAMEGLCCPCNQAHYSPFSDPIRLHQSFA